MRGLFEAGLGLFLRDKPAPPVDVELLVTACPSMGHFKRFSHDPRLSGLRLNIAALTPDQVQAELDLVADGCPVPLYYDVKGRQLRVTEAMPNPHFCDIRLNHPIEVDLPTVVLLKAGGDSGLLGELQEDGHRLVFSGGNPEFQVNRGESIHIRDPSLRIGGPLISQEELDKIERVHKAGITRWFLSYVEQQSDIDTLREVIGPDAEIMLKIESKNGLRFVQEQFKPDGRTSLVAACGDLYVEVERPHDILKAVKLIVEKDPRALAGSRMLLSLVREPVPSFADLSQLAWLYEIGYRRFMLCDELCLQEPLLARAVNVFDAFRQSYS